MKKQRVPSKKAILMWIIISFVLQIVGWVNHLQGEPWGILLAFAAFFLPLREMWLRHKWKRAQRAAKNAYK